MKLQNAIKKIHEGKCKYIQSKKCGAVTQDLKSLKYWLFEDEAQAKTWQRWFEATDWTMEGKNESPLK